MLFTTDKQTLDDLNIFGKQKGEAVYDIFNRTRTRGGAAVLEEMFRHLLSGEKAINLRSGIIRYFAAGSFKFPFSAAQFDAIDNYLANTDERSRLNPAGDSVARKFTNLVAMDGETTQVHKGIEALLAVFALTGEFIGEMALPAGHPFEFEKNAIAALLAEPQWKALTGHKGKLSQPVMAALDALFRFRYRKTVLELLQHIYHLDVYIAVATVAQERHYAFPVAVAPQQHLLKLEGVYHPQVKGAVPNNIEVTEQGNVLFLTGANMAGKSTFMKSVSIALFLAHMGFPVAAAAMEFAVFDGIYTTINLPDNLGMGASHFYAEVLRVKKIAFELSAGRNLFIVFDELFRGTNVKDAYEATIAIVKGFARKYNSLFIISTHIVEAAEVLKEDCMNVRFIYLPTRMNGKHPVYPYTIENGITADRHGMVIINNEGILNILQAGMANSTKQ